MYYVKKECIWNLEKPLFFLGLLWNIAWQHFYIIHNKGLSAVYLLLKYLDIAVCWRINKSKNFQFTTFTEKIQLFWSIWSIVYNPCIQTGNKRFSVCIRIEKIEFHIIRWFGIRMVWETRSKASSLINQYCFMLLRLPYCEPQDKIKLKLKYLCMLFNTIIVL